MINSIESLIDRENMPVHLISFTNRCRCVIQMVLSVVVGWHCSAVSSDFELAGEAGLEQRYFFEDALLPDQARSQASFYLQPEFYYSWNEGNDRLVIKPFTRLDQVDSERSHLDIREFHWLHMGETWEVVTGFSKLFWGQTESLHLVDIVNQTDAVEAVDGEDKLGQPMINFSYFSELGQFSAIVLPYFRERTFAGSEGRMIPPIRIDDSPIYASDDEEGHIDLALRWQHSIGSWDIGLSYFDGTNRDPLFVQAIDPNTEQPVLRPYYSQIQQFGIDLLSVYGDWLFKFEGIYRKDDLLNVPEGLTSPVQDQFFAAVAGFEYTQVGIFDTTYDLGWLLEYQFDEREGVPFVIGQNDVMVGLRLVFNDVDGTEWLWGIVQDLDDSGSYSSFIEASSRMTDRWKWKLDAYFFGSGDILDPLYFLRREDHILFTLEYSF